jgi:hypothetical protein
MPAILIQHPEHGRTHVYNEPELAAHVALGWSVVPEKPAPVVAAPVAPPPAPAQTDPTAPKVVLSQPTPPAAPAPMFARRGRPPKSSEGLV